MDAGEYDTNTLLINNISSVAFKIYELAVSHSSIYTSAACNVEHTLRSGGHLVYADSLRRGIWCFYLRDKDGSSIGQSGEPELGATLDVCGYKLGLVEEGGFEPISLLKYRGPGSNSVNTPSSSSPNGSALDNTLRNTTNLPPAPPSANPAPDGDAKAGVTTFMDTKGYGATPAKDVYGYFIAAVLAGLSSRFCASTGAIPLNLRSSILPMKTPPAADYDNGLGTSAPTIASLRVYLTTTGSLVISISLTSVEGLLVSPDSLSAALPSPGTTVCAAPLGMFGTIQGMTDADHFPIDDSMVQSPDTQLARLRPDADEKFAKWRGVCSKMLEMRGVSPAILSKSSWLNIQFMRRKPIESRTDGKRTPVINPQTSILWPAVLCYRKRTTSSLFVDRGVDSGAATSKYGFDPLNNAKTWFLGHGERDELVARRKRERESATSRDTGETDSRPQQQNEYSPVALRRTSNPGAVAAASAMYPTPPDVVQNPVGATPSLDGTTSSPRNLALTGAFVDIDATMPHSGGPGDSFGDGWDTSDLKREQPFIQAENLFGDLGDDVFADNDITDADFSFFDEQPGGIDIGLPDLPDLGMANRNAMDMNMNTSLDLAPQRLTDSTIHKTNNTIAPPVFAKPELKHARSTLADENRQRELAKARSLRGIKRHPSPFNPNTVYKRLKVSLHNGNSIQTKETDRSARHGSVYKKVDLDPALCLINRKYQDRGRFDCPIDNLKENQKRHEPGAAPTTDYLRRHGKGRSNLKELPANLGFQIERITGALESSSIQRQSPMNFDGSTSDADEVSLVSDQDDASDFSDEPSSPTKSSVRRRYAEDDRESLAPSFREPESADDSLTYSSLDLSKFSNTDSLEISIANYFADSEPHSQQTTYAEDDVFMTIAQILTDQAVTGSLKYGVTNQSPSSLALSGERRELAQSMRNSMQTLQAILPSCLQGATECQFRPFIEVQDVPLLGPPNRMQARPVGGPEQRPSLFQIPAPHIELRRYESRLSVFPSAVGFWESLGLGPCHGPKDIHSVCVFPNLEGMADNASIFLDRLQSVYESMRLGSFERMASSANIQNGLVPLDVDKAINSPASLGSRVAPLLMENMAKLAHAILLSPAASRNFVVYFVYSPNKPNTIAESCAAFQSFFDMYRRTLKKPAQNELVLQLVPIDLLATATAIVVLSPLEYTQLCLETYDRCTLFGGPMPAPAIVLEQPLTRGIEFQLRSSPSANILQENSCMHIAYAQSTDERWVTAAWTDNRGCKQMTASYCMGRKGKPLATPLVEIANEIWETTCELISMWKVHWRVIITKCGPMDQQEIDFWIALGQSESKASISLTLLTVDTNPSLQLIPFTVKIPVTAPSVFYTTPVSTPQASMMSPEQVGNPQTPMGAPTSMGVTTPGADNNATEADSDATLVDVTDTTWGAIVSHRFNNSPSLVELNPAIVSGYLIKRGGTRAEDAPVIMEVNIIHNEGNPRLHNLVLREMLTHFRGLGTIARVRSMVDRETDVRPWHVAAAEKGVRALYQLM